MVQIELPPLRDRREDIGLLAAWFLERSTERAGKIGLRFAPEAEALLERYDYPGNVRELENAVEHAVAVAETETIGPGDLPAALRTPRLLAARTAGPGPDGTADVEDGRDGWSLAAVERDHIRRVLERHRGNATAAARQLGISRTTLWRKLREYGLSRTGSPATEHG